MRFDGLSTGLFIRSEPPMAQILVAESDRLIRAFIAGILNDFGHDVTVCEDSAEATAVLAIGSIDVLLTDLVLRSGEGLRLSDDCAARGVPTITLTGHEFRSGQEERERPTPLLDKPFRFADLQCVIDAVALHSGSARPGDAVRQDAA
jgi:CheY-like chemotaxis protein